MPPPLSLLLGADSLLTLRSGVGRMTLEIARQLETHPEIGDFGLMIEGDVHEKSWLASMEAVRAAREAAAPLHRSPVARVKRVIGAVPGMRHAHAARRRMQMRRIVRERARAIAAASPLPMVYHEPNMIARPYDGPTVATVNDLSWHHDPALHPPERIRWIEAGLPRVIHDAARFVAISAFTKDEMVRELAIAPDRIDVVHLAPAPAFGPRPAEAAAPTLARYDLADRRYLLSVSTLEPRKNFDRLLAAYLALPPAVRQHTPLVIAGGKGWGSVLDRPQAERAAQAGQLRLLGHVPDEDLVVLTARCALFAYVSLYEGFGLPVIEAMAAGAPVLASATTATGETAGDAALLVDPADEADIREGLRALLGDAERRAALAAASLARAEGFTWRRTVDRLVATWRRAAEGEGR